MLVSFDYCVIVGKQAMASGSGSFVKSARDHYHKLEDSERERLDKRASSGTFERQIDVKKVASQITKQIQKKVH